MPARLKRLLILAVVPLLAACEYEGAAYLIEGKDHSISLVREQRWFWSSEVEQAVVVSAFDPSPPSPQARAEQARPASSTAPAPFTSPASRRRG